MSPEFSVNVRTILLISKKLLLGSSIRVMLSTNVFGEDAVLKVLKTEAAAQR